MLGPSTRTPVLVLLAAALGCARDGVGPAGRVTRTRVLRQTDDRGVSATETASLVLEYRLRGDSVEIGSFPLCPPGANCVGNDTGTLLPPLLELSSPMYMVGNRPGELRYEATRPE